MLDCTVILLTIIFRILLFIIPTLSTPWHRYTSAQKLVVNNPLIQWLQMRLITISIEDKCSIKVPLLPSTYQSYPWLNVFVDPLLLSVLSLSSLIFISFPFFLHFFSVGAGQRTRQNSEISSTHKKIFLKSDDPTLAIDEAVIVGIGIFHHTVKILLIHPAFHDLPQFLHREIPVVILVKSPDNDN